MQVPPRSIFQLGVQADGFAYLKPETFKAGSAADTNEGDGVFLETPGSPIAMTKVLAANMTGYVVATEDGAIGT